MIKQKVPFVDLHAQYKTIKQEIDTAIQNVIDHMAFISGQYVNEFEFNFARYCKAKHCVGLGNGTDALYIALKSCGIGYNDEIIVPANSFIATSEAVSMTGAKVIFVDCHPETYNIDVSQIESKIRPNTKAIIPVHLYGQPADMVLLSEISKKYQLTIIQDCAQAHGATIDEKPLSHFGDILCFSFYPGKNLGAYGDAGAIVTNDDILATKARMFANHGRLEKYNHEFEGMNSRMDGIQAAVLNVKLKYLDHWNEQRIKHANQYNDFLKQIETIITPYQRPGIKHVYHLYVIRTKQRDLLQHFLKDHSISTGIHYPIALPNLKAYQYLSHQNDDYPMASQYQNEILSLPLYPELTEKIVNTVCHSISDFCKIYST
jgi:dTDP-4-amino-4,6-dideoxygalactose transaminase